MYISFDRMAGIISFMPILLVHNVTLLYPSLLLHALVSINPLIDPEHIWQPVLTLGRYTDYANLPPNEMDCTTHAVFQLDPPTVPPDSFNSFVTSVINNSDFINIDPVPTQDMFLPLNPTGIASNVTFDMIQNHLVFSIDVNFTHHCGHYLRRNSQGYMLDITLLLRNQWNLTTTALTRSISAIQPQEPEQPHNNNNNNNNNSSSSITIVIINSPLDSDFFTEIYTSEPVAQDKAFIIFSIFGFVLICMTCMIVICALILFPFVENDSVALSNE
jgi:hypothetical protein